MRLARQAGVERLESSGRAEEQSSGVAASLLLQRDLSAQVLQLRSQQGIQRAGLDRDQQSQCRVECAGVALRPRSREQPLHAASGLGRQGCCSLEERGRRGQASPRLRSARGARELLRDVLVGIGRGMGAVPGTPVWIDLRISDLGEGTVRVLPLRREADRYAAERTSG